MKIINHTGFNLIVYEGEESAGELKPLGMLKFGDSVTLSLEDIPDRVYVIDKDKDVNKPL